MFDFYNKTDYHLPVIKNYNVKQFKYYELWKKLLILLKRLLGILLFLIIIVVAGIVFFLLLYIKENKRVNKYRKDIQQQIINEEFAKKIANKYKANEVNNR